MEKTQKQLYDEMIVNINVLLTRKNEDLSVMKNLIEINGLEYAALINEIGALRNAKTKFLLFK